MSMIYILSTTEVLNTRLMIPWIILFFYSANFNWSHTARSFLEARDVFEDRFLVLGCVEHDTVRGQSTLEPEAIRKYGIPPSAD